ncbi:MAG TPA: serine hydrolase domain-containing protein, partial [Puia sp.]|nr:serine hydrolase domain-containing protein [Puia sp.]
VIMLFLAASALPACGQPGSLASGRSSAQEKNDSVCALVKKYFNERSVDSLYALTGASFRKQINPTVFENISKNNLFPLGDIRETSFSRNVDKITIYKAVLSSATFSLIIGLDSLNKLQAFAFQPYRDESARKTTSVPGNNPMSTTLDKEIDSVAQDYMRQLPAVGLSIGILCNGKSSFYGYGETVKGNKTIPGPGTLFEIGSISKTFTATMLALAVGEGRLKLDDPVNRYLPDSIPPLQYNGKPATIRTLSNHTSGIPRMPANFDQKATNGKDPYATYTTSDLYSWLRGLKLTREPGSQFEYSNAGVGLLGTILQKLYGQDYERLLLSFLAKPLGMKNTRVAIRPVDSPNVAAGYDETGLYNGPWNLSPAFAGAGAIRSTARDMLRYAAAQMGGPDIPVALESAIELTHAVTFNDGNTKIALGWLFLRSGDDDILFHNGGTGGYRSYLGIDPKKNIAVVLLSNCGLGVDAEGAKLMAWLENNGAD